MTTPEIIARLKEIELANEYQMIKSKQLKDLHKSIPGPFEEALVEMLTNGDDQEMNIGLGVAEVGRLALPGELITQLLNQDSTRERTVFYISAVEMKELIPTLNQILLGPRVPGRAAVLQCLLNFGDKSSFEALNAVYEKSIEDNPSRRGQFEALQVSWAISDLPQQIHHLPEKTAGLYLAKGAVGTAFPTPNVAAPTCDCCQQPMQCLFQLPKEADPLEMPVFHCANCYYESEFYIDLGSSPPQLIGKSYGEKVNPEFSTYLHGGTIVWGVDVKGIEKSNTFIGGDADWAQSEEEFECPKCEQKMEFVVQMESDFSLSTGLNFFHGGIMYVHRCRECQVACYFFQTS